MNHSYQIAIAVRCPKDRARLQDLLLCLGHEVVVNATSGEDLLRRCATASPHLIITDIGKCDLDFLAVAESLLKEQNVPFIVVACADEGYIGQVKVSGAMAFLTKPVRRTDLSAAISIAMQRFEELQLLRHELVDMRRALDERKLVERAKGIIMNSRRLDEPAAFKWLQQFASKNRQTLGEVARSVILAELTLKCDSEVV